MYRGTPAQFFFQCVNLESFSSKFCLREPCSNFRLGLHSDFKQLITNLGIHCALSEFLWLHVPSKNEPQKFYPRGHPKNMSGILGIFSIAQSHIIQHAILIIT